MMMMAKNREEYTQRCVSSRLREKACACKKERFGSSLYFRAIGQKSDESHYIFSLSSSLFLSREEKRTKRFETRANERVDLQKQNIIRRLLSPFITIRGVLVVVRASEKKEHVGYVEESIQERSLTSSRF
jgi:hypothetical protein